MGLYKHSYVRNLEQHYETWIFMRLVAYHCPFQLVLKHYCCQRSLIFTSLTVCLTFKWFFFFTKSHLILLVLQRWKETIVVASMKWDESQLCVLYNQSMYDYIYYCKNKGWSMGSWWIVMYKIPHCTCLAPFSKCLLMIKMHGRCPLSIIQLLYIRTSHCFRGTVHYLFLVI